MHEAQSPSEAHRLVIVGAGEFAGIAYDYFTRDSPGEVAAFSVEERYIKERTLFGLPVVPFERLEEHYPPADFRAFVAVTYTFLNRARTRLYEDCRRRGYALASYVSSDARVWHNAQVGDNCFLFEQVVVQYHATVGNNVVIWSGSQVLHRAVVEDHCFLSSHVVIGGYGQVGSGSFLGLNCCVRDAVRVEPDCVVGAGAVVVKATTPRTIYVGSPARPAASGSVEDIIAGRRSL
jgi:sugar O-acyltransferase (sialic acid O-acetyltransferase NeuD family)